MIGIFSIFEIETEDSIFHEHTQKQWAVFADHAKRDTSRFYVVVPSGSKDAVEHRLEHLGARGNVWEVDPILVKLGVYW